MVLSGAVAFRQLQETLLGNVPWTEVDYTSPPFRRLSTAVAMYGHEDGPSDVDLVGLIRHALRGHYFDVGGRPYLDVPAQMLQGIAADHLAAARLELIERGPHSRLYAKPWVPSWLPHVPADGVDGPAAARLLRRRANGVQADPFFATALGFPEYRSPGQRSAVRAVIDAPAGSTLAAILPTGEGKSSCFYSAAKTGWADRGQLSGTVVVITPTVALALDQENIARGMGFDAPQLAYRQNDALAREAMKDRLEAGSQGICFVSPEAALGPLVTALRRASERGHISALVIDEAHLVDAWGGVFRPDFQFLAGLRTELLAAAPAPKFRTLLLTATLTASAASVLRALFVDAGERLPVVAAPSMRPEHDYWAPGIIPDASTRDGYLEEAVDCLPRPLIVYTTERADAYRHFERLRARGYRRIGWMSSESSTDERLALLNRWSAGVCDIVVATSAFGLGVNNAEVRAVVHACVPEGIDRFYQEVGRSGRDGRAAVSLVLPTAADLRTGRRLASQKLITVEKGLPRWRQMFRAGTFRPGATHDMVDLEFDLAPGVDPDRINMRNEQNTSWNLRVLALMAISGLLRLQDAPRAHKLEDGTFKERLNVALLDRGHTRQEVWHARVEPYRSKVSAAGKQSMAMMAGFLTGRICVAEAVQRQYEVQAEALGGSEAIAFDAACPGCPKCRAERTALPVNRRGRQPGHPWPALPLPDGIGRWLDPGNRLVIRYESALLPADGLARRRRTAALRRFLEGAVRVVRIDPETGIDPSEIQQLAPDWPMFIARTLAGGGLPSSPSVLILNGDVPLEFVRPRSEDDSVIAFARDVDERYDGIVWPISLFESLLLQ